MIINIVCHSVRWNLYSFASASFQHIIPHKLTKCTCLNLVKLHRVEEIAFFPHTQWFLVLAHACQILRGFGWVLTTIVMLNGDSAGTLVQVTLRMCGCMVIPRVQNGSLSDKLFATSQPEPTSCMYIRASQSEFMRWQWSKYRTSNFCARWIDIVHQVLSQERCGFGRQGASRNEQSRYENTASNLHQKYAWDKRCPCRTMNLLKLCCH